MTFHGWLNHFPFRQASQLVTPRESSNKRARTAHGHMSFAAGQDRQYLKLTKIDHPCYATPGANVTTKRVITDDPN